MLHESNITRPDGGVLWYSTVLGWDGAATMATATHGPAVATTSHAFRRQRRGWCTGGLPRLLALRPWLGSHALCCENPFCLLLSTEAACLSRTSCSLHDWASAFSWCQELVHHFAQRSSRCCLSLQTKHVVSSVSLLPSHERKLFAWDRCWCACFCLS